MVALEREKWNRWATCMYGVAVFSAVIFANSASGLQGFAGYLILASIASSGIIGFKSRNLKGNAVACFVAFLLGNAINLIDLGVTASLAGHILFLVAGASVVGSGLGFFKRKLEIRFFGERELDEE